MRQPSEPFAKAAVLNSWKEIAGYLDRGVRTVQRWEHDLNLPVHRPKGKDRSAVLAFPAELDGWLVNTPVRNGGYVAVRVPAPELAQRARDLRMRSRLLVGNVHQSAESQQAKTEKLTKTLQGVMSRMQDARRNGRWRQAVEPA
ncbi:MAG: hypothetical protein LAO06_10545 [Acidobacteriia bacterium]|nr:hypothetical protein [Terriglobia bacterium]